MTDPTELECGDTITFDVGPLNGVECEVSDTSVQSLGITEVFAVALTARSEVWMLEGTTDNETVTLVRNGMSEGSPPTDLEAVEIRPSSIRRI